MAQKKKKRKKKLPAKMLLLLAYLLGIFYLILPEPIIPNLQDSPKSTEPGDTQQIPGVWAYFTTKERQEVVDFFQESFSTKILLTYRLNHPPEYCREVIQATRKFNFCEELVHPFRESLVVAGWTPTNDLEYLRGNLEPVMEFLADDDQHYPTKITLKHLQSSIWSRILVWSGVFSLGIILVQVASFIFTSSWRKKK